MLAIYVARFTKLKNQIFLLDLIKKINHDNFKLLLLGDGEEKENIKNKIELYSLENKVKLLGHINNEEIPKILSIADIALFPSIKEGFGISILEKMASKLPVVIFKNIYLQEFEDGIIISNDEDEFIYNSNKLLKNIEFRKMYSNKAFRVAQKFDIRNIVKQYDNLIREKYEDFNS